MTEVRPKFSYDTGVNEFLHDFTFHDLETTAYMRRHGFTEEQIAEVTIHLSQEDLEEHLPEEAGKYVTIGRADKDKMLICLHPKAMIRHAELTKPIDSGYWSTNGPTETKLSAHGTRVLSKKLAHELEHLLVAFESRAAGRPIYQALGMAALTFHDEETYQLYIHDPEEIRCRQVEAEAPRMLQLHYRSRFMSCKT